MQLFLTKDIFQSTVHTVWRERNRRRHGEAPCLAALLIKRIYKNMRNKFTIFQRKGDKVLEGGMAVWFSTREGSLRNEVLKSIDLSLCLIKYRLH